MNNLYSHYNKLEQVHNPLHRNKHNPTNVLTHPKYTYQSQQTNYLDNHPDIKHMLGTTTNPKNIRIQSNKKLLNKASKQYKAIKQNNKQQIKRNRIQKAYTKEKKQRNTKNQTMRIYR